MFDKPLVVMEYLCLYFTYRKVIYLQSALPIKCIIIVNLLLLLLHKWSRYFYHLKDVINSLHQQTFFPVSIIIFMFFLPSHLSPSLPEDFLRPQTLEVSAHGVQALKCCLHTQRTKHVLRAQLVKIKGETSYVSPGPRFVLRFVHNCTLGDWRQQSCILITCDGLQ